MVIIQVSNQQHLSQGGQRVPDGREVPSKEAVRPLWYSNRVIQVRRGRRQEAGGRRQEAGGRRQEAGGRR